MSCFKIIEGSLRSPRQSQKAKTKKQITKQKKPGLNEIKTFLNFLLTSDLDGHDRKKSMAEGTKTKIRFSN